MGDFVIHMEWKPYTNFSISEIEKLLNIDSPTSSIDDAEVLVREGFDRLLFGTSSSNKGNALVSIGAELYYFLKFMSISCGMVEEIMAKRRLYLAIF